jgi:hypothetical protein
LKDSSFDSPSGSGSELDRINSEKIVNLTVKKGLWGFDILGKYDAE